MAVIVVATRLAWHYGLLRNVSHILRAAEERQINNVKNVSVLDTPQTVLLIAVPHAAQRALAAGIIPKATVSIPRAVVLVS